MPVINETLILIPDALPLDFGILGGVEDPGPTPLDPVIGSYFYLYRQLLANANHIAIVRRYIEYDENFTVDFSQIDIDTYKQQDLVLKTRAGKPANGNFNSYKELFHKSDLRTPILKITYPHHGTPVYFVQTSLKMNEPAGQRDYSLRVIYAPQVLQNKHFFGVLDCYLLGENSGAIIDDLYADHPTKGWVKTNDIIGEDAPIHLLLSSPYFKIRDYAIL